MRSGVFTRQFEMLCSASDLCQWTVAKGRGAPRPLGVFLVTSRREFVDSEPAGEGHIPFVVGLQELLRQLSRRQFRRRGGASGRLHNGRRGPPVDGRRHSSRGDPSGRLRVCLHDCRRLAASACLRWQICFRPPGERLMRLEEFGTPATVKDIWNNGL